MDPTLLAILGLAGIIATLVLGIPVGFGMGIIGFAGILILNNFNAGISLVGTLSYMTTANFTLSVVPLFILIGELAFHSGASDGLYHSAYRWFGRLPGGLAIASIVGCAGFAAACGSTTATAVAVGKVALPQMDKYGYNKPFGAACLAAGGTLGVLIPPSIPAVIYGGLTDTSVGKVLMAGFIPGIIGAIAYSLVILVMSVINPAIGPRGERFTLKDKLFSLTRVWGILLIAGMIIITIYTGIGTPTEAGAIGTVAALLLLFVAKRFSLAKLTGSLKETAKSSCSIFILLTGAFIFSRFLGISGLPFQITKWIAAAGLSPLVLLALVVLLFVFLGMFIDPISMQVLVVPLVFTAMTTAGFDAIWFGIIVIRMVEIATLSPPLGFNVFVIASVSKVDPAAVYRAVTPFIVVDLLTVALFTAFPGIVLLLPRLMS